MIKQFEELEVGDWFTLYYISQPLFVVSIDKKNKYIEVSSPSYLANRTTNWKHIPNDEYDVIGTSKPNFWYKFFFKFRLICPVKMVK
jgi:hypothetical protein